MSASDGEPATGGPAGAPVVVVGPGRVGQSLAAGLAGAGHPVSVRGRSAGPPPFLSDRPGVSYGRTEDGLPEPDPGRAGDPAAPGAGGEDAPEAPAGGSGRGSRPPGPATLVFCVPDDALEEAAGRWAEAGGRDSAGGQGSAGTPPGVALHTSGVHPAGALAPLRDRGWRVAAWHPLTALPEPRADAFRGVTFAVEGDEAAAVRGETLARELGGRVLRLEPDAHARYHAAAVFASNHLVACLSVAARELEAATGGRGGLDDLLPLARAAVDNLEDRGLAEGATGPLSRGDLGTVRRHLEGLPPDAAGLYRVLARELLSVVEPRLKPGEAAEIRRLLAGEVGDDGGKERA